MRAHEEEAKARAEGGQSGTEARDTLEEGALPSSSGGAVRDVDVDGDEGELARAGKVADKARLTLTLTRTRTRTRTLTLTLTLALTLARNRTRTRTEPQPEPEP